MSEENKALVRRVVSEAWNEGNLEVIDEVYADDLVYHDAQNPGVGSSEALKALINTYRLAFPDLTFEIEDLIAEGEKVVGRWTATGTQEGDLPDIPATGKRVSITGITIHRFADGIIVEQWSEGDTLGMLQQLGVVPIEVNPV